MAKWTVYEAMNIIIDLVLIGVLALCIWSGYKKGLIMAVSGMLALIVAIYGANLVARTYSEEFSSMIQPMISSAVSGAVNETEDEYVAAQGEDGEDDVYEVSYGSLKKLGMLESAAKNLANELKQEVREVGNSLKSAMVHKLASTIAYVLTLIIVFVLIIILFKILANIINLAFKLPGLDLLNCIGGALFGLLKGLILLFAIAWLTRFLGFALPEDVVDNTVILKWLMNSNPIIDLFGV